MMTHQNGPASLYSILKVPADASGQVIRNAIADAEANGAVPVVYLRMAKEILLNPAERTAYDEKLRVRQRQDADISAARDLAVEKRPRRFSLLRVVSVLAIALVLWWSLTIYYGYDPGKVIQNVKNRFDPAAQEMLGHTDYMDDPDIYKNGVLKGGEALAQIATMEHDELIWFPEDAARSYAGEAYIQPMAASRDFRRFVLAGSFGQLYVFRPSKTSSQPRRLELKQVMWDQHANRLPLSLALSADGDTAVMAVMEESAIDPEELSRRGVRVSRQDAVAGGVSSAPSPEIKKRKGIVSFWDIAGNRKLQDSVYTAPGLITVEGGSMGFQLSRYHVIPVQTKVQPLNDSLFLFGAQSADIWTSRLGWKKYHDDLRVGLLDIDRTAGGGGKRAPDGIVDMQYAPAAGLAVASFRGEKNRSQIGLLSWKVDMSTNGWLSRLMEKKAIIPLQNRLDWQDGTLQAFRVSADGTRVAILGESAQLHLYSLPDFGHLSTVTLPSRVFNRADRMIVEVTEDSVALLSIASDGRYNERRRMEVAHFVWRGGERIDEVDAFCAQRLGFPAEGYFGYISCDESALHILPARPDSGRPDYLIDLPVRFE